MDWIKLAIPLVVLAIWILGHLWRNQQEEVQRTPRRLPPKPEEDPVTRPRRPTTDVDRFLEEVRRRRERQPTDLTTEEQEAESGRASDAPAPRPVPPPLPAPRQPEPAQPIRRRPLREPPPPPPGTPAVEEVVVARLVAAPGEVSASSSAPTAGPPPAIPSLAGARRRSAGVVHLLHLLKTPQSLATAVLLREVFEAPLSRRGGTRRGGRA